MEELADSNVIPRKPWYKKWWALTLLVLFILFLFMLSVIGFFVYDILKNDYLLNDPRVSVPTENLNQYIYGTDDNYWTGTKQPKITIVEFSDFACPYCKETFPKIREISKKYQNEVKVIFRDYPIVSEYSDDLALAGRCAGEQGLFWVMHDKLFLNQGINEIDALFNLAGQIGADQTKFEKCFNDEKYIASIQKDYDDGIALNITGTPTWFINGVRIEGNIPYDIFINIIEDILKEN
jgi:protein-disulfide isomerase